jgi:hypothetical protein
VSSASTADLLRADSNGDSILCFEIFARVGAHHHIKYLPDATARVKFNLIYNIILV